ncbi:MAG: hypothetical protein HQL95_04565 [Magnetococcales bacterium]|nr:hypothetical protein [Magnetococcales bacterium]
MRNPLSDICQDELPETLREIRDVIGWPATIQLVQGMGGVRVAIPKKMRPEHALVALLGADAAGKLAAMYGGENLKIPRAITALRCQRDREILRRYDEGERLAALAREYQLDLRTIERIIPRASLKEVQRREARQLAMDFGG